MFAAPGETSVLSDARRLGLLSQAQSPLQEGPIPGCVGDGLASRYSALASDSAVAPQAREAAILFSLAEAGYANSSADAIDNAERALGLFRSAGDAEGEADALRLLIAVKVDRNEDESADAMELLTRELDAFRERGIERGAAVMELSLAELVSVGRTAVSTLEATEAVQRAQRAREVFQRVGDPKMALAAALMLSFPFVMKSRQLQKEECSRALDMAKSTLELCKAAGDVKAEARILHAMAVTRAMDGDDSSVPDSLQHAQNALGLWRQLEDQRSEVLELNAIAKLHFELGALAESMTHAQQASTILQELRPAKPSLEVAVLSTMVRTMICQKELDEALFLAERKVAGFQNEDDAYHEALALQSLFMVNMAQGDHEEALRTLDKAQQAVESLQSRSRRSRQLEAYIKLNMVDALTAKGRAERAESLVEPCIQTFTEIGDGEGLFRAHCALTYANLVMCEYRDAIRSAADSRDVALLDEDRLHEGVALLSLCCAHLCKGGKSDVRRAVAVAKEAQDIFNEEEHRKAEACALYLVASASINAQDYAPAMVAARKSMALYREEGCPEDECNLMALSAHCQFYIAMEAEAQEAGAKATEQWNKALKLAEDALAMSQKRGSQTQIGKCLLGVAQVHAMMKKSAECEQRINEALEIASETKNESAEAYAYLLHAQMFWALKQEDRCLEPAKRAFNLFKDLEDARGTELAEELMKISSTTRNMPIDVDVGDSAAEGLEYSGPSEEMLLATVTEVAFSLIGGDQLDGDTPLMDAGLDSLASVEFQNTIAKEFGAIQLPSTLVFDYPTPKQIGELVFSSLQDAFKQGKLK